MRSARVLIAAAISALGLALGAATAMAQTHDRTTLHGRVTDADGRPIAAAYIAVSDGRHDSLGAVQTAADGSYRLEVASEAQYGVWAGKTASAGLFRYIPVTKEAAGGGPVDFRLSPGGNIVIAAYDAAGRRLDNRDFRAATRARVFLTDLAGAPAEGSFSAIHPSAADLNWDTAVPTLVVRPGVRYKIFVEWEVPQVGRLLYPLDNGGSGYVVAQPGGRLELDLNLEIARSSLAALRRDGHGAAEFAEALAESARHLEAGQADLAARAPDHRGAAREFALSVKASLAARERLVLARARADIERYRKGQAIVSVVGPDGTPVPGALVEFHQTDNDFVFGANPLGQHGSYDPRLAGLMRTAGFNESYITARWGRIEQRPGEFDWSNIDSYQRPTEQRSQGFNLLGALSLWFTPNTDFSPRFLQGDGAKGIEAAVYQYARRLAGRYAGRIDVWELNEFNLKCANAYRLDWAQRVAVARAFVQAIKDANPKARIMNGSLALPFDVPDSRPLAEWLRAGIPTDIVGLEIYPAGINTDGGAMVGQSIVSIDRVLDQYAAFGKPILVKEFSVPSAQLDGSSWWHGPWDEARQAEFVRDVYTVAFSKPLVHGITWSWGVTDQDAFIRHGGLINADLRPKQAYYALKSLLASWRTSGQATTDRAGTASFKGFAGNYQVAVRLAGGAVVHTTLHVKEQAPTDLVIHVPYHPTLTVAQSN